MNKLSKTNSQWIPLQANVFSRWITSELKRTNHPINITKDLSDGTALIELAEKLTHKKIEQNWSRKPKSSIKKTQNCDLAIDLLKKNGVKIVGISGKDISDNNEKLILGLIWSLISHYSIGKTTEQTLSKDEKENNIINSPHQQYFIEKKAPFNETKKNLLSWANKRTENYPYIHNFKPYDLSMCALLDSYFPEKVHFKNLNPEKHQENSEIASDVMIELGIPVYIYSDDLKKNDYKVDEKTLLTQLSSVKSAIDQANIKEGLEIVEYSQEVHSNSRSEKDKIQNESESEESENYQIESEESENETEKIEDEKDEEKIEEEKDEEKDEDEIVEKELEENEEDEIAEKHDDADDEYSSEEDLVSEPALQDNTNDEYADDEEVQTETTEASQYPSESNTEDNKIGFKIEFKDDVKGKKKHSKKKIRIRIKGGDDKNGFEINEEEVVKSFMKKYLSLSNVGQDADGAINKNVNIRVKYHGKIISKTIQAPFHDINVHLRRHNHNENIESENSESPYEIESEINDNVDERFEEENNEYEEDQTEENNSNNAEENNSNDTEENNCNNADENNSNDVEDDVKDLEKEAELQDEIEADAENEHEAECDENDIKESNKVETKITENDQSQHLNEGKKFGLVITLKGSDYNNGERIEENQNKDGPEVRLALTLVHCDKAFLNSAGLKLDLAEENIKNNTNQQFVFGKGDNYTVIDSETKHGMVWDVANADETNPPSGTPFYLFPFHGRHNQRFIYKNEMIYALQNNQVVTYVGGYTPLVMMPPREDLKSRQTFHVNLL